jgi:hypothetical protein
MNLFLCQTLSVQNSSFVLIKKSHLFNIERWSYFRFTGNGIWFSVNLQTSHVLIDALFHSSIILQLPISWVVINRIIAIGTCILKLKISPSFISEILLLLAKVSVSQMYNNRVKRSFLWIRCFQYDVVNHKALVVSSD